jgi:hypothetical protein
MRRGSIIPEWDVEKIEVNFAQERSKVNTFFNIIGEKWLNGESEKT